MNNKKNLKDKFRNKILINLKKNKNNFFSDGKKNFFYEDIHSKYLELKIFLKKNNIEKKKILSVIYNQSGIYSWINFLVSFLLELTVMPLEKNSDNYKKIEKYFDVVILFDGKKYKIIKKIKKKKNKIIEITEYISSTSGSTGFPKMILHKFDSIIKNSLETSKRARFKKNKNFLIAIPSFYNSAVCHFLTCLIKDMNFYFLEGFMYPKDLNYYITKYRINYFGGAPIQTEWILGNSFKKKNYLEKILSSGDFLKDSIIKLFLKKKNKINLYNIYGITEVGGRVFVNDVKNSKNPFSLGRPLSHFNIVKKKISKKIFEIGIKSNFNFLGYYSNRFSQTNKYQNTYFTNDLAYEINKEFKLQGRKNEIFKSSGIKIFPEYIKNEILKIKGILNAYVFSKHFDLVGNMPVVAYESKKKLNEIHILNELGKTLQKKQIPIVYKHYIKFPYLKNKKLNKIKLKNEI